MPNNDQDGGNNGGPWGSGSGGGSGGGGGGGPWGNGGNQPGGRQTPPELEKMMQDARRSFGNFGRMFPGGAKPGRILFIIVIILFSLWLLTGFYRVNPQQQGVVLRFGEWVSTTGPGLHYQIPYPIEQVLTPEVTRDNRLEIGFRDNLRGSSSRRDVPDESLMITGDENIIDIDFVVFWRISDAGAYLFNLADPDGTIKVAAESVMREVIGETEIQNALTDGRESIQITVRQKLQDLLDEYKVGVRVREVQLLAVDPPEGVIDAFIDVQRARQDRDRLKNEAEAIRNDIVPRARGEAAQLIADAEAYEAEVLNRAQGDASRFNQVYDAYVQNKEVTKERIYLETLEEVFGKINKIIIDDSGTGVVPYLPLNELNKNKAGGN